jgi:YggT family protein
MFIFGNLLLGLAYVLNILLTVYMWIVIISALISWVNPDPYNPIVKFLRGITEPAYRPIRRFIGARLGIIDISPLIVIVVIIFIKSVFVTSLIEFAYKLKTGGMV